MIILDGDSNIVNMFFYPFKKVHDFINTNYFQWQLQQAKK